jgi:hypothetical protein
MAKTEYKRLTRARSSGAFAVAVRSHTSLWLGADHLLFVNSTGYTETYKRFYFRDIQTFVVQNTQRATVVNIVLTILLVLLPNKDKPFQRSVGRKTWREHGNFQELGVLSNQAQQSILVKNSRTG